MVWLSKKVLQAAMKSPLIIQGVSPWPSLMGRVQRCCSPDLNTVWFSKRVSQHIEESDCSPLCGKCETVSGWSSVSHLGLPSIKRALAKCGVSSGRGLEHMVHQER